MRESLLGNAKFFVLPSYSENFGLVIAESLAAGRPVLTTTGTPWGAAKQPGDGISEMGDGISDMGDGRSEAEEHKSGSISISNIPSAISAKPGRPGFVRMMCRQNNTKITGSEPLPDVNAEGEVAERFRILREWKLPAADLDAPVKLHRVSCTGSIGLVVVKAGKNK